MKRRGKAITILTMTVGLVVLVAAGIAAMPWLKERYYLRRLDSQDIEEQRAAIEALISTGSEEALDRAIRLYFAKSWGLRKL